MTDDSETDLTATGEDLKLDLYAAVGFIALALARYLDVLSANITEGHLQIGLFVVILVMVLSRAR